jgi:uncharacterized protein YggU (UPF0235/DUF167 family)
MKIQVMAHPRAKKSRIEKDSLGVLHVYVSKPPIKGEANKAVTTTLATYLHCKERDLILLIGEKSKKKIFEILNS